MKNDKRIKRRNTTISVKSLDKVAGHASLYKEQNRERASWALEAVKHHPTYDEYGEDVETTIVDLLADLRHLAEQKKLDFEKMNTMAEIHYNMER